MCASGVCVAGSSPIKRRANYFILQLINTNNLLVVLLEWLRGDSDASICGLLHAIVVVTYSAQIGRDEVRHNKCKTCVIIMMALIKIKPHYEQYREFLARKHSARHSRRIYIAANIQYIVLIVLN